MTTATTWCVTSPPSTCTTTTSSTRLPSPAPRGEVAGLARRSPSCEGKSLPKWYSRDLSPLYTTNSRSTQEMKSLSLEISYFFVFRPSSVRAPQPLAPLIPLTLVAVPLIPHWSLAPRNSFTRPTAQRERSTSSTFIGPTLCRAPPTPPLLASLPLRRSKKRSWSIQSSSHAVLQLTLCPLCLSADSLCSLSALNPSDAEWPL